MCKCEIASRDLQAGAWLKPGKLSKSVELISRQRRRKSCLVLWKAASTVLSAAPVKQFTSVIQASSGRHVAELHVLRSCVIVYNREDRARQLLLFVMQPPADALAGAEQAAKTAQEKVEQLRRQQATSYVGGVPAAAAVTAAPAPTALLAAQQNASKEKKSRNKAPTDLEDVGKSATAHKVLRACFKSACGGGSPIMSWCCYVLRTITAQVNLPLVCAPCISALAWYAAHRHLMRAGILQGRNTRFDTLSIGQITSPTL